MNLERHLALSPFGDFLKQRDSVEPQITFCFVRRVQMVRHSNVSPQFCLELTRNTASKLVQIMTVFTRWFCYLGHFRNVFSVRQSFQIQLNYAYMTLYEFRIHWERYLSCVQLTAAMFLFDTAPCNYCIFVNCCIVCQFHYNTTVVFLKHCN